MTERDAPASPTGRLGADGSPCGAIDWAAPWLDDWRAVGQHACRQIGAAHGVVAEGLNRCSPAAPVRFVAPTALPPGQTYERFVHDTGQCPTRNVPHDFWNGLAWLRYPATKTCLNRLHAQVLARHAPAPAPAPAPALPPSASAVTAPSAPRAVAVASGRGTVRDRATLFDENGAVLFGPAVLHAALADGDWTALFLDHRAEWASARLLLFGHALLEKLA